MRHNLDYLLYCVITVASFAGLHLWLKRRDRTAGVPLPVALTVVVVLAIGAIAVNQLEQQTVDRLQRAVIGLAPTYAMEIERLGHQRVQPSTPEDDPTYLSIIDAEKRWLAANPVVNDIYTFRPASDSAVRLIVDSETDYNRNGRYDGDRESRTAIGEELELGGPFVQAALLGRGGLDPTPSTDRWGTWVTAYWPLHDSQGRVEAILGVDYGAAQWISEVRNARYAGIALIAVILLVLFASCALHVLQKIELAARQAATAAMREARDTAECANRVKSEFLACMSHEIRTPMNGVMGITELLLQTRLDAQQRHYCELVSHSATNLLGVLNDILDYSKMEAQRLDLEQLPFDPAVAVREVAELQGSRATAKSIRLTVAIAEPAPARVLGDTGRLRQILNNLIGNAVKFSDHGDVSVAVSWRDAPLGQVWMRCEIRDSGPGMDAATISRLFEPFVQADSSITRRYGGTGLGLAICKRLVERMSGTIGCQSAPGAGSTFWFEIPFAETQAEDIAALLEQATSAHEPGATGRTGRRVLLAEDAAVNQLVAEQMLISLGCQVDLVSDGLQAVAAFQAADPPYDLIFMDCEMPQLDGCSATRRIRELETARAADRRQPIVALTAHAADSDRQKCLAAGMDGYLSKPMALAQLQVVVAQWLPAHGRTDPQPVQSNDRRSAIASAM